MSQATIKMLEDGRPEHRVEYEYKSASLTIAGTDATTDITGSSGFTTLFDTVPRAHYIKIETSGTAYFRLNSSTNDKITVTAATPFTSDNIVVENLFTSTGGAAITVTVTIT